MQILYINKLQSIGYEQHTYAIMGVINKIVQNFCQRIFINNNHQILVKIHTSIPNLHCRIYDSNQPMLRTLPNDIIYIYIEQLLYRYANVMQQIDNGLSTITSATNITFGIELKKSKYVLSQLHLYLRNNINCRYISPFPKYSNQNF